MRDEERRTAAKSEAKATRLAPLFIATGESESRSVGFEINHAGGGSGTEPEAAAADRIAWSTIQK